MVSGEDNDHEMVNGNIKKGGIKMDKFTKALGFLCILLFIFLATSSYLGSVQETRFDKVVEDYNNTVQLYNNITEDFNYQYRKLQINYSILEVKYNELLESCNK